MVVAVYDVRPAEYGALSSSRNRQNSRRGD